MLQSRLIQSTLIGSIRRGLHGSCRAAATGLLLSALVACGGTSPDAAGTGTGTGGTSNDPETTTRLGNGLGTNFVNSEIGIQNATIQSGASTQLQLTIVDADGDAITDPITATVNSECIASGLATLDGDNNTISGVITLTYTANGCSGADALSANVTASTGETLSAAGTITVEADAVLSVQFIEAMPLSLSLRGVGGEETSRVSFQLVGQQSAPIVGETVNFTLSTAVGGVSLAEDSAVSDNMGMVTAIVQSGTVHTTVVVTATHEATDISGNSDGINISTGVPQANRLTLSVDDFAPRAWSFNGTEVTFSIIAADQFGNPVPDDTVISFASPESGTISPSCSTVDARCSVTWVSSDPRPVDGRATIIAFTSGAEEFTDTNGNSVFDDADVFDASMDLDEPFVDENESGFYDSGEFFHDFNSNGMIDLADGMWNGPLCEHSSLCGVEDEVGISQLATLALSSDQVVVSNVGSFPAVGGTINIEWGTTVFLGGLFMSDINGNSMVSGTTVDFSTDVGSLNGTTSFEVPNNTTQANGAYGVALSAPTTPENGVLTLSADVPGVLAQEFFWAINTSCTGPAGLAFSNVNATDVTLSTTSGVGSATTTYSYEYGPAGFVEGAGTVEDGGLIHLLTGLDPATSYDVYVRANCGGTRSNTSAGPVNFTTP
ncbi:MAG: fibronectin type III domain-containing protein [Pseudomonadota bacterium]